MHYYEIPDYLEEQLTKHEIPYTRFTRAMPGCETTMECITITRTQSTIAVNQHGVRYGHILGKLDRQKMWRWRKRHGGRDNPSVPDRHFEIIRSFGHELDEQQLQLLVTLLVTQG